MSDDPLDQLDYYTLLEVDDGASVEAIKAAFKRFARKYHPDRFLGETPEKQARATRIFRRGSEAFQVLTEPDQRDAYDRVLASGIVRLTEDASAVPTGGVANTAPAAARATPADAAPPAQAAPSAGTPIRSEAALEWFKKAVAAAKSQQWRVALSALAMANELEPGNAFLKARYEQVEAMVRGR